MIFNKKNTHRPLYKQFLKIKENAQNRRKLLKFKKQKWNWLIKNYRQKLKNYKKFKQQDQFKYLVTKFPNKNNSYKKRFKNSLLASKKFRLFYGGLSKKETKKIIKKTFSRNFKKNFKKKFLELMENKIDTVLYRSKFSPSIKNARQLIVHKKIYINKKIIQNKSYILKSGDLITISHKYKNEIIKNIKLSEPWPIPPKHLFINYKTMEILIGNIENTNTSTNSNFNLNLEKILINYYKN